MYFEIHKRVCMFIEYSQMMSPSNKLTRIHSTMHTYVRMYVRLYILIP